MPFSSLLGFLIGCAIKYIVTFSCTVTKSYYPWDDVHNKIFVSVCIVPFIKLGEKTIWAKIMKIMCIIHLLGRLTNYTPSKNNTAPTPTHPPVWDARAYLITGIEF